MNESNGSGSQDPQTPRLDVMRLRLSSMALQAITASVEAMPKGSLSDALASLPTVEMVRAAREEAQRWVEFYVALERIALIAAKAHEGSSGWASFMRSLSVKARNLLCYAEIESFEQLCGMRGDELLEVRGLGETTLAEITRNLKPLGLSLRGYNHAEATH